MKTIRLVGLYGVAVLAALFFLQSIALADGGGTVAGLPLTLPTGWPALVLVLCVFGSWAMRKFSGSPFFHSTGGAAVAGVLTAAFPALIQTIQSHGINLAAIETALVGAVLSFVASDNPSNSPDEQAHKVIAMRAVSRDPKLPPPITHAALLPLVFIVFALSGCPASTQAFTACELGKLPQTEQSLIAEVTSIVETAGADWEGQLATVAAAALPGQVDCVVQAIAAGWASTKGEPTATRKQALDRLQQYQHAHPAKACAPRPVG